MRVLILGGTIFVGRALVEAALQKGHQVTLFNRGKSGPDLFPQVESLHGDRDGGLGVLEGRQWDAVIDTSGYVPRVVRQSAELLKDRVEHYTFISTISVYQEPLAAGSDEEAPLSTLPDETIEDPRGEYYGPLKVRCEQLVQEIYPQNHFIPRPCIIVGPHDRWDRFAYWLNRVDRGGEILVPGKPERRIQFIDVRDLGEWVIRMVEQRATGIFNAVGPQEPLAMSDFLETCKRVSGSKARFTWVDDSFLAANQVGAMWEMPFWMPETDPSAAGMFSFDNTKAVRSGLTFRPVEQVVAETLAWDRERPAHKWRAGLSPEKERELLEKWKSVQG